MAPSYSTTLCQLTMYTERQNEIVRHTCSPKSSVPATTSTSGPPLPVHQGDGWAFKSLQVFIILPLRVAAPVAWSFLLWVVGTAVYHRTLPSPSFLLLVAMLEAGFHLEHCLALKRLQHKHEPPTFSSAERRSMFNKITDESGGLSYGFLDRWFPGAESVKDVGVEDLRSWMAWALFGKNLEDVPDREELDSMLIEVLEKLKERGVTLPPGSTGVTLLRLNVDPVESYHRPFIYYVSTYIMEMMTSISMKVVGFRRFSMGKLWYYLREPEGKQTGPPIIFVHGVGMGLATYVNFVHGLVKAHGQGRRILMLELPHVSMKLYKDDVPSMESIVDTSARILERHNLAPARWVGHSLGSCVLAAVVRRRPDLCHSLVFLDPVCFLLWEVDVTSNFCYRVPTTAMEHIIHYHISRELYINHYFHRHFWWYENVLFPSQIPEGMSTIVFVSEKDDILNAGRVLRYLQQKDNLSVHELKNSGHGGWIINAKAQARILAMV